MAALVMASVQGLSCLCALPYYYYYFFLSQGHTKEKEEHDTLTNTHVNKKKISKKKKKFNPKLASHRRMAWPTEDKNVGT